MRRAWLRCLLQVRLPSGLLLLLDLLVLLLLEDLLLLEVLLLLLVGEVLGVVGLLPWGVLAVAHLLLDVAQVL